ncbi:MotA/TolQ/ExbB proton channel family protein [Tichowtungia aerotolerans]|uniref:MotA/TolQ/ExbB proton channel family protein n=1 Tax=Tichowtungia aerotolerans TaxID=2697043 RepID=A0A6P1M035_9BACT|nr:MotA/TolQ/ExbB proton channel family protein [Tichowtungia aerotolerans]QHI68159.1 MotA/TolQ/ExbB proton channel family protein [Tichowtungia aerotolerans]
MLYWINSGGPLMWLILAGGVIAMVIFFERLFHLHRAQIDIDDFFHGITTNLKHGNDLEAIAICDQTPGPAAHLVRTAILNRHEEKAALIRTVQQAGIKEVPRLERHTNLLITLAQILPMIGLLGTVLGLLSMLVMLQQGSPLAEIGDLAGGLWTALLTTAAGLMTGIPAYAGYHFLVNRVEAIAIDMEQISSEIIFFLTQSIPGDSNEPQ